MLLAVQPPLPAAPAASKPFSVAPEVDDDVDDANANHAAFLDNLFPYLSQQSQPFVGRKMMKRPLQQQQQQQESASKRRKNQAPSENMYNLLTNHDLNQKYVYASLLQTLPRSFREAKDLRGLRTETTAEVIGHPRTNGWAAKNKCTKYVRAEGELVLFPEVGLSLFIAAYWERRKKEGMPGWHDVPKGQQVRFEKVFKAAIKRSSVFADGWRIPVAAGAVAGFKERITLASLNDDKARVGLWVRRDLLVAEMGGEHDSDKGGSDDDDDDGWEIVSVDNDD